MADPFSFAIATVAQIGISYLFPSEGPRLKDLKISASTYGAAIPWVFGLARVPGNMIWAEQIREQKSKKSGKGGSYTEYSYYCTFAMGLCKGSVKQIRRIWADSKLIYDASSGVSAEDASSGTKNQSALVSAVAGSKYRMRFYLGDEDQVPDSAIEADLGVGQAPAFRGLSYILFDDMPLDDFGQRIPQITVEVMVGEVEPTAIVAPLKEADGIAAFDDSYAAGEGAFDFQRSIGYLRYGESLRSFNLRNARAMVDYAAEDFAFADGDTLSRLLCCGLDGSVYVLRGAIGSTASLDKLDAYSLQSVETVPAVATPVVAAAAQTDGYVERLLTIAANGDASIFTTEDMALEWNAYIGGAASAGAFKVCGRDADATGNATFYVFRVNGADLTLSKIAGTTQSDVLTFSGTATGAALWDSASPGVIMFWSDGSTHYVSKWSEDTGEESWRQEIGGYPTVYYSGSRLLIQKLGWIHSGHLLIIDTLTGEYIDGVYDDSSVGQPDWDDYLARYPAVLDQYYIDGWTVASSPQGYAQWHWTNYGQGEGRTLNYITDTKGQGYALSGDYAGAEADYQAFDSARGILVGLEGMEGIAKASNITGGVSVGTVVARLLEEAGMSLAQTDLSAIYAIPLRGYGWASGTDVKGIFDELRRLFLFDLVERDGLLVAVVRGEDDNGLGTSVEVIPQNALGNSSEDAIDFWQETRMQEADLPAIVTLAYMNVEDDYETSTARSARITNPIPTMFSRQQVAMEINVVMTAKEAKIQTNKILYSQWSERTRHTTRLPWSYLNLDPADVITVEMNDGRSYEDRIHNMEIGADFSIATEAYAQDSGAYSGWDAITVADGGGDKTLTTVRQPGLSIPFIINTPLLRDLDDQGGSVSLYYVGQGNALPGTDWYGAGLFRATNTFDYGIMPSPDDDVEWGTVVGTKLGLPAAGLFALDWKSELRILPAVDWFDIESITDAELWDGANACLVGNEIIQFRDCVENEDGSWTLTNLLRGRRGTEYACNTHKNGEKFVFLSNNTIGYATESIDSRGQTFYYKSVADQRSLPETASTAVVYEPRDLMPYAPSDIRLDRDTSDVTISWSRRTRLGGNLQDGTGEVPLAESSERYEAYILDAPFSGDLSRGLPPDDYLRKYETTVPYVVYSAAEQGIDGFSPAASTLHVVIYQLSDAVGRGFPGVRSIYPYEDF